MSLYPKHWPSMFKRSDYQNSQHGNSSRTGGHDEERTSQPPKPRWIPTPEQVQILEGIFNSGMISPSREEIKKLHERLREYGPIAEINIFYWFQNRKARKIKHTQPNNVIPRTRKRKNSAPQTIPPPQTITPPLNSFSSSSSYHQNAPPNEIVVPNHIEFPTNNEVVNLTNDYPNDTIFGNQNLAADYFYTPNQTDFQLPTPPLFSFPNDQFSNMTEQLPQNEIFMNYANRIPMNDQYDQGNIQDQEVAMNMLMQQQLQQQHDPQPIGSGVTSNSLDDDSGLPPLPSGLPPLPPIVIEEPAADPFSITQFQGVGEADHFPGKCTVRINNELVEVDEGPFNIRQIFGDEAILVDSFGQLVLTNEWGETLDSLQHGASYFLL